MPNRPAVPKDIALDVMIESGHRCAVCGISCSLEKAHIIPWSEVQEHTLENLICLCATCHTRSHDEKWDVDTLREYKRRPWVVRQFENYVPVKPTVQVQLTIDALLRDFTDRDAKMLPLALAALLDIPPQDVHIRSVKLGSVNVIIDLPEESARKLLRIHKRKRRLFSEYLAPLKVLNLRLAPTAVEPRELTRLLRMPALEPKLASASSCASPITSAGADRGEADLRGLDLHGFDLSWADLRRAHLSGADLSGADLSGADLYGADLCGADLSGADLCGADLSGADLYGADLSGADLYGADLSGANLHQMMLNDATNLDGKWRLVWSILNERKANRNLHKADLSGANLVVANLWNADLREADLSGANLGGANLRGANLGGADLVGAELWNADLREANLSGANLSGANLRGANLGGANLRGANLGEAYLGGVNLKRADLSEANLIGAKLRGAYLNNANLRGANLLQAEVPISQLNEAEALEGATLPDGTVHE